MCLKCSVWVGLGLFALLSATDWVMTFALLRMHPGAVEANPLAASCLARFGWNGLAVYKFVGVLIVVGAVLVIARRRPAVAAAVTAMSCAVLLSVTVYTHQLICESQREIRELAEDAAWPKPSKPPGAESAIPDHCWFAAEPSATPTLATVRK